MLEEDLKLVGYSAVVGCVFPSVSRDQKTFVFRYCQTLQMKAV